MSKLKTVYGAGHVNIRKYHSDVAAVFEYSDCLLSVYSFNNLKTRILDRSDRTQANQCFIFDDEDRCYFEVLSQRIRFSQGVSPPSEDQIPKLQRGKFVP